MNLLGSLRVRLTAETEDYRRGLKSAQQQSTSFTRELQKLNAATLAKVASFAALTVAAQKSLEAAKQWDSVTGALAASARFAGQDIDTLNQLVRRAESDFKLGSIKAHELTMQIAELADKAGGMQQPTKVMQAFLDIGASRGLSAAQSLEAVQDAVRGSGRAIDTFFNRKPEELYGTFARSIGKTVGELTEAQKAQALVDAALRDGESARGEYQAWLKSAEGLQFQLNQGMESASVVLGRALQPAIVAVLPLLTSLSTQVAVAVEGFQRTVAALAILPALVRAAKAAFTGGLDAAREEMRRAIDGIREEMDRISKQYEINLPVNLDLSLGGRGAKGGGKVESAGKEVALRFFSGLEEEWERLRHTVALRRVELTGTDSQRLEMEEAHALRLLSIEEQQIRRRHELRELNDHELRESLRQLDIRREIARARTVEMDAANRAHEQQLSLFQRGDELARHAVEMERIRGQVALTRLGSEGSIGDRLRLQLGILERTHELQRQALLNDARISDTQLQNELLRLDLARQREEVSLRSLAAVEEELRALSRNKDLKGQVGGMLSAAISGQVDAGSIGGTLGSMLGNTLAPGIGAAIGGALGARLGGLFGNEGARENPVVQGLRAIERAQRETITTIDAQTQDLLRPERRLLNLPTDVRVPGFMPSVTGGGTTVYHDYAVNVELVVHGNAPDDIDKQVERAVTKALTEGIRNRGRSSSY